MLLTDDARKINPLWNPMRMAREAGQKGGVPLGHGHFLALDGFGPRIREKSERRGFPLMGKRRKRNGKQPTAENKETPRR